MKTAVQKIIEELLYHLAYDDDLTEESRVTLEKVVDKCKGKLEMEKQQIIDSLTYGNKMELMASQKMFAEQYYTSTYGSKGSDEIEKSEKPINLTSSQTKISDEEIEQMLFHHSNEYAYGFKDAIKWYREQLKKKQ